MFSAEECGICEISCKAMYSPPPSDSSYLFRSYSIYKTYHGVIFSLEYVCVGISGLEVTWNKLNTHTHTKLRVNDVMLDNVLFVHLDWIPGVLYLKQVKTTALFYH